MALHVPVDDCSLNLDDDVGLQLVMPKNEAHAIPTVTVTSSENTEVGGFEQSRQDMEEAGGLPVRPNDLPLNAALGSEMEDSYVTDRRKQKRVVRTCSAPLVPDFELNVSDTGTRRSQPNFATVGLLSPGAGPGGYESDLSITSGGITDYDDCDSSPRKARLRLEKDRADSDPTEAFSPRKRALKSIKTFKNNLKLKKPTEGDAKAYAKTPNGVEAGKSDSARGKKLEKLALAELALGTIKLEENISRVVDMSKVAEGKENVKKQGRSKWKRKRKEQLTRVAQKLSDKQGLVGRAPLNQSIRRQMDKVLSPSYKQKNDDFHKFFKDLPVTERLLVDYTCALVKDILVQGRLYVSQNYLCFHSNILKWQTAVTVKLIDIDTMTKEKTVKVIPNAIQFLMKDKSKMTFTSFTARDRAYLMTFKLWQNALLEKPMSARDLWCQIHSNYGEELGLCSSDDDYVKPEYMPRKHQSIGDADGDERYQFGTTNKVKKKKKSSSATQTPPPDGDGERGDKSQRKSSSRHSSHDSSPGFQIGTDNSTADEKSIHSSQCTNDEDVSEEEEDGMVVDEPFEEESKSRSSSQQDAQMAEVEEEEDDGPADFVAPDCSKVSLSRDYDTSAQDMFRIIFGDDCPFWKGTLIKKQSTDIEFGAWIDDDKVEGQKQRDLSYTLKLDNPIGPKTSHCKEQQILSPNTVHGKSYAVDCIVQNYGIPYADYFQTCMRYCIKKVTKDTCHLRITSELRYKKTPWGLIKNFLEKNVAIGLSDNFTKLEGQIQQWVDYEKQKGTKDEKSSGKGNVRRRKRKGERGKGDAEGSRNLPNGLIGDVATRKSVSDLNNNEQRLSSGDMAGERMLHPPNGFIPNGRVSSESPKLQFFGPGGRLIAGAIVFIFLLLIYSNYSMYQRLTTLEQVTAAAATADGVDPSVTAALLDRPGIPISSSPEILSTYLQAIDKRLRRLEDRMGKFMESSGKKWDRLENQWSSLMDMMQAVIQQKSAKGG